MSLWDPRTWFGRGRPVVRNDATVVTGLSFADFVRLYALDGALTDVTPTTAMKAIPVQACCSLIAGGIISMPLRLVRRDIVDGVMLQAPADDHDYWWLFNEQPNSDSTAALFWEQVVKRYLLWGRGYARIVRKAGGRSLKVDEIVFTPNENCQPEIVWDDAARRHRIARYLVRDGSRAFGVLPEDMLDFRGAQAACGTEMSEMLYSAREAIAIVLTIEEYCSKFFANGGMPRTVLTYPAGVAPDEKQQKLIRDGWVQKYGGAENAGLPLILGNGGKPEKMSFTAEEAQMLEARKFQVIEIARSLGVPPFMIGETEKTSAWGSGIESMGQGFIRYSLGRHITSFEQEINRKLFRTTRHFVDFDEEALARGDMKSLGEWFRQAVGGAQGPGFMSVNEVRGRLKLQPKSDGDSLFVPKGDKNESSKSSDGAAGDQSGEAPPV